jgi:hypothetical protein
MHMPEQNNEHTKNVKLAEKYRPLLVLFPEIEDNSHRRDHHQSVDNKPGPISPRPGRAPLDRDYHPRDIRLILDHAYLPGGAKPQHRKIQRGWPKMTIEEKRNRLLNGMSEDKVTYVNLIDRHGPQQVDKFWAVYAGIKNKDENPEYRRTAYARVIRGKGYFKDYISIQYWLAYFFDDWANVHEMDWEMTSIIIKKTDITEEPVACIYCSHIGAFRKLWKDVDKVDENKNKSPEGLHPVAYIAIGSHATYFSDYPSYFNVSEPYLSPGLQTLVRALGIARPFTDYIPTFEEGDKHFPEVAVIPVDEKDWIDDWRWLKFTGKWGSPVELSFFERIIARVPLIRHLPMFFQRPIREAAPKGPNTRGTCWENPFDWVNLECLDAVGNRNWIEKPNAGGPTRLL